MWQTAGWDDNSDGNTVLRLGDNNSDGNTVIGLVGAAGLVKVRSHEATLTL